MAKLERKYNVLTLTLLAVFVWSLPAAHQLPITNDPPLYGPWNGLFSLTVTGCTRRIVKDDSVLRADSPWSMFLLGAPGEAPKGLTLLAGAGNSRSNIHAPGRRWNHIALWWARRTAFPQRQLWSLDNAMLAATFDRL